MANDLTGNNGFNHRDTGSGGVFTHRPANTSLGYRSLATPTTIIDLLPSMTTGRQQRRPCQPDHGSL